MIQTPTRNGVGEGRGFLRNLLPLHRCMVGRSTPELGRETVVLVLVPQLPVGPGGRFRIYSVGALAAELGHPFSVFLSSSAREKDSPPTRRLDLDSPLLFPSLPTPLVFYLSGLSDSPTARRTTISAAGLAL